jgi:hypothetical protein
MVSIVVPLEEKQKMELGDFPWVNWSEVVREYIMQREIFEEFMRTGEEVSDKDWEFCEKINWHPVDWLPFKEEYLKRLEAARKEKPIKLKSISDIFK